MKISEVKVGQRFKVIPNEHNKRWISEPSFYTCEYTINSIYGTRNIDKIEYIATQISIYFGENIENNNYWGREKVFYHWNWNSLCDIILIPECGSCESLDICMHKP